MSFPHLTVTRNCTEKNVVIVSLLHTAEHRVAMSITPFTQKHEHFSQTWKETRTLLTQREGHKEKICIWIVTRTLVTQKERDKDTFLSEGRTKEQFTQMEELQETFHKEAEGDKDTFPPKIRKQGHHSHRGN